MSKISSEAFTKLASLIDQGYCVQIDKHLTDYEITVFYGRLHTDAHSHFQGKDLIEAVMRACKE